LDKLKGYTDLINLLKTLAGSTAQPQFACPAGKTFSIFAAGIMKASWKNARPGNNPRSKFNYIL
jgi:hypothetical protein